MSTKERKPNHIGGWFLFLLAIPLFLGIAAMAIMIDWGKEEVALFKDLGPWGDFYGGVLNPALTFLAFFGVLITIVLQKIELGLTRDELERSAEALEKQNFENTFFQMLQLHNSIVNSIDLSNRTTGQVTQGRDCFQVFYTRFNKIYRENQKKGSGSYSDGEILSSSYKSFWRDHQLELGHYYRYLYNIIRYIEESSYPIEKYMRLVRAQLSDQELLMLFYNCLSPQGKNFKRYAEQYALFDNMPLIRVLNEDHLSMFANSAYGDNPDKPT